MKRMILFVLVFLLYSSDFDLFAGNVGLDDPDYRRLESSNQLRSSVLKSDSESDVFSDFPGIFEFHVVNNQQVGLRLYENSGDYKNPDNQSDRYGSCGGRVYNVDEYTGDYKRDSIGAPGHVISFLGMNNSAHFGATTNYGLYVDTAYINRGTGWIKPQYMLAVDVYKPEECGTCNPETGNIEGANVDYLIGRYLYNTSMYAKAVEDSLETASGEWVYADKYYDASKGEGIPVSASATESGYYYTRTNFNKVQPVKDKERRVPNGAAYLNDGYWERFAFAWAIHKGDSLYVLKGVDLKPMYKNAFDDPHQLWLTLTKEYGVEGKYVDFQKLIDYCTTGTYREAYYPSGDESIYPEMRTYRTFKNVNEYDSNHTIGLHAIIALDDNTHKDWVLSFRLYERGSDDFVIESETTKRNTGYGSIIRPGYGGWIKTENGVPVISHTDVYDNMGQAEMFNVLKRSDPPVKNEPISLSSSVKIRGGKGYVQLINASGKKVVVQNMLGQLIYFSTISSNDASITVPSGIVIVSVEGELSVKVVVN